MALHVVPMRRAFPTLLLLSLVAGPASAVTEGPTDGAPDVPADGTVEEAGSGTFSVAKTATADDGSYPMKEFTFDYVCLDPVEGELTGQLIVSGQDIPVAMGRTFTGGTECTVSEDVAAAEVPGYELAASDPRTFTITAGGHELAGFLNEYSALPEAEPSVQPTDAAIPSVSEPAPSAGATETPEAASAPSGVETTSAEAMPAPRLPETGAGVGPLVGMTAVLVAVGAGLLVARGQR